MYKIECDVEGCDSSLPWKDQAAGKLSPVSRLPEGWCFVVRVEPLTDSERERLKRVRAHVHAGPGETIRPQWDGSDEDTIERRYVCCAKCAKSLPRFGKPTDGEFVVDFYQPDVYAPY